MGYLSDVTRRRIAAVLLAIGIVVAAMAIENVGPFSNPPSQQERAQGAIEDFFAAANDGDFQAMCGLVTPAIRQQILRQTVARLAGQVDVHTCGQALAAQNKLLSAQVGEALTRIRIAKVEDSRVSGNRAAVDVELAVPGAKQPQSHTYQLELVGDQWKISGPIL